ENVHDRSRTLVCHTGGRSDPRQADGAALWLSELSVCVTHRRDVEAPAYGAVSVARNSSRLERRGNWPAVIFLKNAMASQLRAEYASELEDFESSSKIVKFVVVKKREEQDHAPREDLLSFEAVMLPHLDAAHNLARWLLRNEQDAQDVVQEAYLRAFKAFAGLHGSNGRAWLLTIVRNTSYTLVKQNRAVDLTSTFDEEIHGSGDE